MEKNTIPVQLQRDSFGFVKLKPRSKIPFEQDWQNRPYSFRDIESWLTQDANYGVLGGQGDLVVIDADTAVMSELIQSKLPATFTVKTPRSGHHFYYFCSEIKKKIVLKKDDEHFGEIISVGSQVVGPGSIHPETGTEYQVIRDLEIATVSREQIFSELIEYIPADLPQKDTETEVSDLSVMEVLRKAGIETKQIGRQFVGGHPVHGSTNNNNFVVNPEKNVWHCFRCGSGGGAITLIAVLERIIDCREAMPGSLRGDKFNETLKIAAEKYGFQIKRETRQDNTILTENRLTALESKIRVIPADTAPVRLPQLLDPILKEIAGLNIAQGDAILKHTIKDHFGLTNDDLKGYEKVLKSYRKEPEENEEKKSLTKDEIIQILRAEEGNKTVHPAQDFNAGLMTFAAMLKGKPYLITSNKRFFSFEDAQHEGFSLKHTTVDTARFSYKGISGFLEGKANIDIPGLYEKIYGYITRFIRFPDKSYPAYLSLWVMGTYFFMIFRYYPYVWLNAEKGSGKTLLMEILSAIAFNGELITNPTESVIFRDISNNLITMFIDEVEQLRKRDKDTYGSLISVLNAGFNKSGVVKRCESSGMDGFIVKSYSAYSPKMFAGINEIDDVLQDRTVKISLLRKKDDEAVQRYKGTTETLELQRQIRDELYTFALVHAVEIAEYYHREGAEGIEGMAHLNNRELDIWEPVFLLANIVDAQCGNTELTDMMEALSSESVKEKQSDSVAQNETFKILNVLKIMLDELTPVSEDGDSRVFDAGQVFEYFKKTEDFDWIEKTNVLTRRLKKVKAISEQRRIDGEKKRVYILNIRDIADLCERFKI
ncbi:MAG: bifunctional DNA primase/polymerase [Candidatus Omnitrophota bacterium]